MVKRLRDVASVWKEITGQYFYNCTHGTMSGRGVWRWCSDDVDSTKKKYQCMAEYSVYLIVCTVLSGRGAWRWCSDDVDSTKKEYQYMAGYSAFWLNALC